MYVGRSITLVWDAHAHLNFKVAELALWLQVPSLIIIQALPYSHNIAFALQEI